MDAVLIAVVIGICIIGVIVIASLNGRDKSTQTGRDHDSGVYAHNSSHTQSNSNHGHWGGSEGSHAHSDGGGSDGGGDSGGGE